MIQRTQFYSHHSVYHKLLSATPVPTVPPPHFDVVNHPFGSTVLHNQILKFFTEICNLDSIDSITL